VLARTEAELARKEDLVSRSLAGSSVSGTDAGVDLHEASGRADVFGGQLTEASG
jgi:hypothetical protein